ncbi:MAG: hypothetical protein RMX96_21045 [Nostoc sp. ChiSLP02]|nr:hypothetical protein [Nostoc sp. DedSLP05]MDZ8100448.1 hypothetical protein [Nostoc sp. DedSLP01]MDZ8187321.1 hypothetical protein [Nostoc sp. ChiSLP02]
MTTEKPNSFIDFSHANEPPASIERDKQKEAVPVEPEEVTGQSEQNPTPDDLSRQEDPKMGDSQIISANISAG